MKELILSLGQTKATIFIAVISIFFSVITTLFLIFGFDITFIWSNFLLSIIIPAIVAPLISWTFLKTYYEVKELQQELQYMLTYDLLTGLLSRKAFFEKAEETYQAIKDQKRAMFILYMDLDNFKLINDTYGHAAGDEALRLFGKQFLTICKEDHFIGRIGGEEFLVMATDTNLDTLTNFTQVILKTISESTITINEHVIRFTTSIGVAEYKENTTLDTLIMQADKALYQAKNNGKNSAYLYSENGSYILC